MDAAVCKKVRSWLKTGPGFFSSDTPHTVLQMAWGASGLQISLGDFTDSLYHEGLKPVQRGVKWGLVLPSKPN